MNAKKCSHHELEAAHLERIHAIILREMPRTEIQDIPREYRRQIAAEDEEVTMVRCGDEFYVRTCAFIMQ